MSTISSPSTLDVVARWEVPLSEGVYTVEFEHGTASGMRGIFINGKCIRREEFKFLLIGEETFKVGSAHCTVQIKAVSTVEYGYFLLVNGIQFDRFLENQAKLLKCWVLPIDGQSVRVVLRLDSMEVYSNGEKLECTGEFTDNGSETHFLVGGMPCIIRVSGSSARRRGLSYALLAGNCEIPEAAVDQLQTWESNWS